MNSNENKTNQQLAESTNDVWLPVPASQSAQNTVNPIRRIVDRVKIAPNPSKAMIALSIGDPTHYGNMLPPVEALEAVADALQSPTAHGYAPSFGRSPPLPCPRTVLNRCQLLGLLDARRAVAQFWSRPNCPVKPEVRPTVRKASAKILCFLRMLF